MNMRFYPIQLYQTDPGTLQYVQHANTSTWDRSRFVCSLIVMCLVHKVTLGCRSCTECLANAFTFVLNHILYLLGFCFSSAFFFNNFILFFFCSSFCAFYLLSSSLIYCCSFFYFCLRLLWLLPSYTRI